MRCTLVWPDLDTPQRLELISVDNQRNVRSSDNVLTLWSLVHAFLGFPESFGLEAGFGCLVPKGQNVNNFRFQESIGLIGGPHHLQFDHQSTEWWHFLRDNQLSLHCRGTSLGVPGERIILAEISGIFWIWQTFRVYQGDLEREILGGQKTDEVDDGLKPVEG